MLSIAVLLKVNLNPVLKYFFGANRQLSTTSKQGFIFLFLARNISVKNTFCFILIGEKRLRQQSEDPRTHPSHQPESGITPNPRPRPPNDLEEGEVEEVGEIFTPPSDVLVVEGQAAEPFSTDSVQRLIGQIKVWNGQIDRMREQIDSMRNRLDSMQQEMKNMIDVLGKI
ncbi:hypothetical protein AB205_0154060 [Aquarana catesbeiana]|uniref:Uncharacterized protein n=1 Tax=Aquarana catesbeiana TaxID=8400 RepID=A0A2G9RR35_AQUCT|nr:hypothetical protein AB205_0154060 [Aquarana catesbeiana]